MEELKFTCPYCKSAISVLLDTGIYTYENIIEDCEVCCRPIEIAYQVQNGTITTFSYNPIEGNEF